MDMDKNIHEPRPDNGNIWLRACEPEDIDMLYVWENDASQWASSLSPFKVSRRRIADFIEGFDGDIGRWPQLKLVVCCGEGGEAVGSVDVYDIDLRNGHGFAGIYIDRQNRGRGFGRAAVNALVDYCRGPLGLNCLAAMVAVDNMASRHMFASCGFVEAGILGGWLRRGREHVDVVLLQKKL